MDLRHRIVEQALTTIFLNEPRPAGWHKYLLLALGLRLHRVPFGRRCDKSCERGTVRRPRIEKIDSALALGQRLECAAVKITNVYLLGTEGQNRRGRGWRCGLLRFFILDRRR